MKDRKSRSFADTIVIYWSDDDEAFVAHSLRTDQVGIGDRLVDALADAIRAVEAVREAYADDSSIELFREAPDEIQAIEQNAEKLPEEIYDIAYKMAHGCWPQHLRIDIAEDESLEDFARRRFAAMMPNPDCEPTTA